MKIEEIKVGKRYFMSHGTVYKCVGKTEGRVVMTYLGSGAIKEPEDVVFEDKRNFLQLVAAFFGF